MLESHEFRLLHVGIDHGTVFVTQSLTFSIGVPLVMILNVSHVLVERVIQVTIDPGKLRNVTEVEGNLGELTICLIIEVLPKRIHSLVDIRVD